MFHFIININIFHFKYKQYVGRKIQICLGSRLNFFNVNVVYGKNKVTPSGKINLVSNSALANTNIMEKIYINNREGIEYILQITSRVIYHEPVDYCDSFLIPLLLVRTNFVVELAGILKASSAGL